MTQEVVVVGAGYAGTGAVQQLERELDADASLTWISATDYHLVLHESHRVIRDPGVQEDVAIPIEELKRSGTDFVEGRVTGLDTDAQTLRLADDRTVEYDYAVLAIGSRTAFYGIPGLQEHSHTLKSLDDALAIHDDVMAAARDASHDDPATVVVGGAGLSGIQSAGEIAALRDEHSAPIEIHLVEGLDNVFPPGEPELQDRLHRLLDAHDIQISTGEFIGEVDEETVYIGEGDDGEYATELDYDVLLWTGGITGRDELADYGLEQDERSKRVEATATFETSDDRVFAIGDTAVIEQPDDAVAPPTAQAAWQAADVAAANVVRRMEDRSLKQWVHKDKGTLISVGDDAIAHDVEGLPFSTFDGIPAETLKKAVAARWIADISSYGRAISAWSDM
jgi:NADH dehydrogenase